MFDRTQWFLAGMSITLSVQLSQPVAAAVPVRKTVQTAQTNNNEAAQKAFKKELPLNQRGTAESVKSGMIIALSGNGLSAKPTETRSGNSKQTFADWCRQKDSLSPEAKHTVEVLLEQAGTRDCDKADQKLSSLTELSLRITSQISDIKPLASLINLTRLSLERNQISDIKPLASLIDLSELDLGDNVISDIKPLASLTNLTWLALSYNQISDIKPLESLTKLSLLHLDKNRISNIKPLESLTNLTDLSLSDNVISDIQPVASLTNLTVLSLDNNKISDIKPLASLTKLTDLSLSDNVISDIQPLVSLNNLTKLDLSDNQIGDIKSLVSLTNLTNLSLGGNPIALNTCPFSPESICNWGPPVFGPMPELFRGQEFKTE